MKRILIIAAALIVVIVAVAAIGLRWYLGSILSEEFLVEQIEASNALRAEIGEIEYSIFSTPARLELRDVILAPPDDSRDQPYADRTPIGFFDDLDTGIRCGSAALEIDLVDLMRRRLTAESAVFRDVIARTVVTEDGESTLNRFFEDPNDAAAAESSVSDAAAGQGSAAASDRGPLLGEAAAAIAGGIDGEDMPEQPIAEDDEPPFHVDDIPLPGTLRRAAIENGRIEALIRKTGAMLLFENLQAELTDVDIDRRDLAAHNTADLALSCTVAVDSGERDLRYCELHVTSSGHITPFDPETGFLNPEMVYTFVIAKGSIVDSLPLVEKLRESVTELEEYGIDLDMLRVRGELREDAVVKLALADEVVTLAEDVSFSFKEYLVSLDQKSWLDIAESTHEFSGALVASKETTDDALAGLDEWLSDKTGDTIGRIARDMITETLVIDGHLALAFASQGDLSDPDVDVLTEIDFGDILKEAGKRILKEGGINDLLKGLLGN